VEVGTLDVIDIWWPFVALAAAGVVAVWVHRWALVAVAVVYAYLVWRLTRQLPDRAFLAVADPAVKAAIGFFWKHAYAAMAVGIIVPLSTALLRWRRVRPNEEL
jgi:hypothetical protein